MPETDCRNCSFVHGPILDPTNQWCQGPARFVNAPPDFGGPYWMPAGKLLKATLDDRGRLLKLCPPPGFVCPLERPESC
jgi:hypothetical protein